MNLSRPSLTRRPRSAAHEPFSFSWIEVLAVPVASSLMEVQPFVLGLLLGSLVFTGASEVFPLVEGSFTLLVLSLYWWALLVRQIIEPRIGEKWATLLYLPGLVVTFAVISGTHPAFLDSIPQLVFSAALSTWLWRRGMVRVEQGLQEEQLITVLKVGFVVLLGMLFFALVYPKPDYKMLLDALMYALPLFFLSGLVALSLSHLSAMKKEYLRRAPGSSQADPTAVWSSTLLFLWVGTIVLTIILEAFAFDLLVTLFSPLVNALEAFLSWLLSLITNKPPPHLRRVLKPPPGGIELKPIHPYHNSYAALLQLILVVVLIVLALFVLLMVVVLLRRFLHKRKSASDEDEVREQLPVRATLRAHRKRKPRRPQVVLEPLDATSARARYRGLLQAMARRGDDLGRRPEETPIEYQARLLTFVKDTPGAAAQQDKAPADAAILDALTRAYTRERYGGKSTDQSQRAYLDKWAPWLVRRLTRGKST